MEFGKKMSLEDFGKKFSNGYPYIICYYDNCEGEDCVKHFLSYHENEIETKNTIYNILNKHFNLTEDKKHTIFFDSIRPFTFEDATITVYKNELYICYNSSTESFSISVYNLSKEAIGRVSRATSSDYNIDPEIKN